MTYLETYHSFLKERFGEPQEQEEETDQSKGLPAPPAARPHPEDATLIELTAPEQLTLGRMPVAQAVKQRRSRRQYSQEPLTLDELSFLLWTTQGVQRSLKNGFGLRTVPAGSARHPFETYLSVHRITGLKPGLYRYLPVEHKLCLLHLDAHMAERTIACLFNQWVRKSAVVFVWAAIPYRRVWRSSNHQHYAKDIALEVGHVCQNLYLACEAIGAGTCAIGGYFQRKMDALLGIDGDEEFTVYVAPVGKVKQGETVEWSGKIDAVTREGDTTRMWLRSSSPWGGDLFLVEFPVDEVSEFAEGDYVAIQGEMVDVCSSYNG